MPSVNIRLIKNNNAIVMDWGERPTHADVRAAFYQIMLVLNQTNRPLHVIVDLSTDPNFPMDLTVAGIQRVNRHPLMAGWLIVGADIQTQIAGSTINTGGRPPLYWFRTHEGALGQLEALERHA